MTQTVFVEGNIGSGKTTFLSHFKGDQNVHVLEEPVSRWKNCNGFNLLDLMYKEPRKWSFPFQSYVLLTMLENHTNQISEPIRIMERSVFSAKHCFIKNMRETGLLTDLENTILDEWLNFSATKFDLTPTLIVYLKTTPETAFKRIYERGRQEESQISMDHVRNIHKHHENWLVENVQLLPCEVVTIDADKNVDAMLPDVLRCKERILQQIGI